MREGTRMVNDMGTDLPPTRPTGDTDDPQFPTGGGGPATEDAPIGIRIGRDPSNVGDEVPDAGDTTFPETVPAPAQM